MAITMDSTPFLSPPITGSQFWVLVASDGDRVVAMRDSGSGPAEVMATFDVSNPFVWTTRATPTAFSRALVLVDGDTILAATDFTGSYFRHSMDAGATWSDASPVKATNSMLRVGDTVILLHSDNSISTAAWADLSSWTNTVTDLPALTTETRSLAFFGGFYYVYGGLFGGSVFAPRVYRSSDLTTWALVYSDAADYEVPWLLSSPTHLITPHGVDSFLTSANGTAWAVTPTMWGVATGRGVVADNGITVFIAGSGFRASGGVDPWDALDPGFVPAGNLLRFNGGVIAGKQVAGSRDMGFYVLNAPTPQVWWKQLVNSTQEVG